MRVEREGSCPSAPASADNFTGGVWRTDFVRPEGAGTLSGSRFTYLPGARSHWHVHDAEQALIVVTGRGLVDWRGSDGPQDLSEGDWVYVAPGVPHWHGAQLDSVFAHVAVTAGPGIHWIGPVSDEEYLRPPQPSPAVRSGDG
jgi:quercetin dioxygenase-like cupin family protein